MTKPAKTVKKKSVSFPAGSLALIEKFPSGTKEWIEFSTKVQEIVRDLSLLLDKAQKEILPIFSEAEWNYLRDALNGVVLTPDISYRLALSAKIGEGAKFDNLAEKWSVDADYLASKVLALSEFDAYAVAKSVDAFWVKQ